MKLHTIATIALVALVVTAGAATAAPGNAPVDPGTDASDRGASDDARHGEPVEKSSAADSDASAAQGPGADLPEQVPDFVAQTHERIRQFLNGSLDGSLGEAISGITAADGGDALSDGHASGTPADASG